MRTSCVRIHAVLAVISNCIGRLAGQISVKARQLKLHEIRGELSMMQAA